VAKGKKMKATLRVARGGGYREGGGKENSSDLNEEVRAGIKRESKLLLDPKNEKNTKGKGV